MKKNLLVLFASFMMTTPAVFAQNSIVSSVDVRGEGMVRVVPDQVAIRVKVEHSSDKIEGLKVKNDDVVREVLKFLKKNGVADKDVRTEYMNLSRNYDYNLKEYSFVANQSIRIRLRDLSLYETIIHGLLDSGINRFEGIEFLSSKYEQLASEARIKAVRNAKEKAEEYAGVLGQNIGKAITISEFQLAQYPGGGELRMMSANYAKDSVGEESGVALGEMEIRATVNIRFVLD